MKRTLTRIALSSRCRPNGSTIAFAALGTASIAYCVALKLADPGKFLDFSLVWVLFGLILWLVAFRRKPLRLFFVKTLFRPGVPRAFTIAFLSIILVPSLIFLWIILTPITLISSITLIGSINPTGPIEYGVLLGGGIRRNGKPTTVLESRIGEAARAWRENPNLVLVVTGGKRDRDPCTEAESMARTLTVRYRVPADRILLEGKALDTIGNFALSRALIDRDALARDPDRDLHADPPRVAVITSGFHMNRSLFLARRAGVNAVSARRAGTPPLQAPNAVLREVGSYWKLSARLFFASFTRE